MRKHVTTNAGKTRHIHTSENCYKTLQSCTRTRGPYVLKPPQIRTNAGDIGRDHNPETVEAMHVSKQILQSCTRINGDKNNNNVQPRKKRSVDATISLQQNVPHSAQLLKARETTTFGGIAAFLQREEA